MNFSRQSLLGVALTAALALPPLTRGYPPPDNSNTNRNAPNGTPTGGGNAVKTTPPPSSGNAGKGTTSSGGNTSGSMNRNGNSFNSNAGGASGSSPFKKSTSTSGSASGDSPFKKSASGSASSGDSPFKKSTSASSDSPFKKSTSGSASGESPFKKSTSTSGSASSDSPFKKSTSGSASVESPFKKTTLGSGNASGESPFKKSTSGSAGKGNSITDIGQTNTGNGNKNSGQTQTKSGSTAASKLNADSKRPTGGSAPATGKKITPQNPGIKVDPYLTNTLKKSSNPQDKDLANHLGKGYLNDKDKARINDLLKDPKADPKLKKDLQQTLASHNFKQVYEKSVSQAGLTKNGGTAVPPFDPQLKGLPGVNPGSPAVVFPSDASRPAGSAVVMSLDANSIQTPSLGDGTAGTAAALSSGRWQTTRYLRVANAIQGPVEVSLLCRTQTDEGGWEWLPVRPSEGGEPVVVKLEPGEVSELAFANWRVNASRVRLWARSADREWTTLKNKDLWLVPETDARGRLQTVRDPEAPEHGYFADNIQTMNFTLR